EVHHVPRPTDLGRPEIGKARRPARKLPGVLGEVSRDVRLAAADVEHRGGDPAPEALVRLERHGHAFLLARNVDAGESQSAALRVTRPLAGEEPSPLPREPWVVFLQALREILHRVV